MSDLIAIGYDDETTAIEAMNEAEHLAQELIIQPDAIAAIIRNKDGKYKKEVYVLPKSLDEKVARLHLAKIGVKLTELRKDQAEYIGVKPEGPFKADHYRY